MKKLIGVAAAMVMGTAGFFAAREVMAHRVPPREKARAGDAARDPQEGARPIPIPETTITLKHALELKDEAGNPPLLLEAGAQLVTESTQGLDYIVTRDGRRLHIHCDDAYEKHGRFTNGQVEQLAIQMAAEIRASGRAPTNERIVARAQEALEEQRLNALFADPASLVESLQRVLLLQESADREEIPAPPYR